MVYGISFCPISKNTDLKELGVDDSKVLTEEKREELFGKLEKIQIILDGQLLFLVQDTFLPVCSKEASTI